ncbi:hypothetical protein BGX28_008501, partial [Mortierella sp. GBA30]
RRQWNSYLAKAVYDVNNRVVSSIGTSPTAALMGYVGQSALRKAFRDDVLFSTTEDIELEEMMLEGNMARFTCNRESIREQAYQNRLSANDRMKRYYDRKVRMQKFEKGELVYVFNTAFVSGFRRKLKPRWLGPYEVV